MREETAADELQPAGLIDPESFGIGRLFYYVREAVVVADDRGCIVLWNPSAERIFGYSAAEAVGRDVAMLVPKGLQAQHGAGFARFAASGHGRLIDAGNPIEVPALRRNGEAAAVELTLSPVEDALLPGRFALAVIRDVSERKLAERERAQRIGEALARAEAEAAVQIRDAYLSSISHDLRAPLTTIKGMAQLSLRRARRLDQADAAQVAAALERIDGAANRMIGMIDELLDLARLEAGRPVDLARQPVDLVALVRQAAAEQQRTTDRHRIIADASVPQLVGEWDPPRLERVLTNLLTNAIKYSPEGGEINVLVRLEQSGPDGEPWAILIVQDPGLGIPAADLPHIFERFYRGTNVGVQISGAGIGLAGSKQIVEQLGGSIGVESQEGAGSRFTVRLPLTAPP